MTKRFDVGTRVKIVVPRSPDFHEEHGTILELGFLDRHRAASGGRYKVMIDKYKDYYYISPEHVQLLRIKCVFDA